MDALWDVLRAVKLTGAVFLDAQFHAPWCLSADGSLLRSRMPAAEHFINYHYIAGGSCHAMADGGSDTVVEAGHVLVFPHGDEHVMGSAAHLAPRPMASVFDTPSSGPLMRLRYGGEGTATHVVCGFLACDPRLCRPILSALPKLMKVNIREGPSGDWLERSIHHSLAEAESARAGSELVLAKLSELLFVETLRCYIEALPKEHAGWFAGLRDPLVGGALALMHGRPAHPWTVDELAREVGGSRSVLAERFKHHVGMPPVRYLANWRLAVAASMLRTGTARLGQIAEEVGYESETAFNRAFKREHGVSPNRWRNRADTAAPAMD